MASSPWYPSVGDVLAIHEAIVEEYPDTDPGVRDRGAVEFAIDYVRYEGPGPEFETVHERAFHLLRLLVANHPFVDGNKRTALNTTAVFYLLNGYEFDYDDDVRAVLKQFGTDERAVDREAVVEYLRSNTEAIDTGAVLDAWRDDLVEYGLDRLSDPND
jgi:death-on-curing protein